MVMNLLSNRLLSCSSSKGNRIILPASAAAVIFLGSGAIPFVCDARSDKSGEEEEYYDDGVRSGWRWNGFDLGRGTLCEGHSNGAETKKEEEEEEEGWFYRYFPQRQLWKPKRRYPAWDDHWDSDAGTACPEQQQSQTKGPDVTRHIILVRHGQYDETHKEDEKRTLTELGRSQAEFTGKRLAQMAKGMGEKFGPCHFRNIRVSDMTRAKETANIISKYLEPLGVQTCEPDALLNEGIPAQIIPVRPELNIEQEFHKDGKRIEEAFRKYIYRAKPNPASFVPTSNEHKQADTIDPNMPHNNKQQQQQQQQQPPKHEFEIIVCHGNVIRYFFCRALQLPPEAWLRMSVFNCSLTYLMIKPNTGYVSCRMLGDVGHLEYDHCTFSMNHGFAWM